MSRIVSAFIRAHTTPEPDVPPPEPEKDPPPDDTPLPETPPIEAVSYTHLTLPTKA